MARITGQFFSVVNVEEMIVFFINLSRGFQIERLKANLDFFFQKMRP